MLLLSYTAGLRAGEVWNLTWTDVDLDAMTVSVNPKDGDASTWKWMPKDHERRTLPLTLEAKLALMRLPRVGGCPYMVVPERRWTDILNHPEMVEKAGFTVLNNFLRQYHVRCRWAKVPMEDFHALRKTCITNWLEANVPPHEVQHLAGHSSIETTMKYYAMVDRAAIDRAREASSSYTETNATNHAS